MRGGFDWAAIINSNNDAGDGGGGEVDPGPLWDVVDGAEEDWTQTATTLVSHASSGTVLYLPSLAPYTQHLPSLARFQGTVVNTVSTFRIGLVNMDSFSTVYIEFDSPDWSAVGVTAVGQFEHDTEYEDADFDVLTTIALDLTWNGVTGDFSGSYNGNEFSLVAFPWSISEPPVTNVKLFIDYAADEPGTGLNFSNIEVST